MEKEYSPADLMRIVQKEFMNSLKQIDLLKNRASEMAPQIPDLERKLYILQQNLNEITSRNYEKHEKIKELQKSNNWIKSQIYNLRELINIINSANKNHENVPRQQLDSMLKSRINAKVEEIADMTMYDTEPFNEEEIITERNELVAKLQKLKKEIDILSELKGNWTTNDNALNATLSEFCNRYTPEGSSYSIYYMNDLLTFDETKNIEERIVPPEVLQRKISNVDILEQEFNIFLNSQQMLSTDIAKLMARKAEFLESLAQRMKRREVTEKDIMKFEQKALSKLRQMGEHEPVKPLVIPQKRTEQSDAEAITNLIGELKDFIEQHPLKMESDESQMLSATEMKLSASIPQSIPQIKTIKSPTVYKDISKVTTGIQSLADSVGDLVPIDDTLSITESYRSALLLPPIEQLESFSIPRPVQSPKKTDVPDDLSFVADFRMAAEEKLPPQLMKLFDGKIDFELPKFNIEPEEPPEMPPLLPNPTEELAMEANPLLRVVADLDLPPMPVLDRSILQDDDGADAASDFDVPDISALLAKIDALIDPKLIEADIANSTAEKLEARLKEVDPDDMTAFSEDDSIQHVEELQKRVSLLNDDTDFMKSAKADFDQKLSDLQPKRDAIAEEVTALERDVDALEQEYDGLEEKKKALKSQKGLFEMRLMLLKEKYEKLHAEKDNNEGAP